MIFTGKKQNMKTLVYAFTLFLCCNMLQAQNSIGIEFQANPTGIIPGVSFTKATANKGEIVLRLAANIIDHKDFGVQDSEVGAGFGGGFGYRKTLPFSNDLFYLGLRTDLWRNTLDWDTSNDLVSSSGTTKVWVLQPTTELGVKLQKEASKWVFQPSLSFGREINIQTDGAEVGQGWIALLGFSVLRKL